MRRQTIEPRRIKSDLARRDRETATDQVKQRGLAGTIRSDQRVALTGGDTHAHAADDLGGAEILGHVGQCERRWVHRAPPGCAISIRPPQTRLKCLASVASQTPPASRQASEASHGTKLAMSMVWPNSARCLPSAMPMVRNDSSSTIPTKPNTMTRPGISIRR